jgi:hypothetical protein
MNKKILIISLILFIPILVFTGCTDKTNQNVNGNQEVANNVEQTEPEKKLPEPTNDISPTAKYEIEFIASWSSQSHPNYYPSSAHFSPFVAYSHNALPSAQIFSKDSTPTPGVEEMSESGAPAILIAEIQKLIDSNLAYSQTRGARIDSPGNDISNLTLHKDYSNITFVSMLAPSPDWFVAGSTNLIKNNKWLDRIELNLITYDSGGDSGQLLTSSDIDTNPKETITVFDNYLQNLGKIVITKIK